MTTTNHYDPNTLTGPYTNVLDLYLFPSMSHRHSAHLQRGTNTEPSLDRIWQVVESVWRDTVSAEVARSCIQALTHIIPYPTLYRLRNLLALYTL